MTNGRGQDEQRPVSVDGGWFAEVDGEWRQVPNPNRPARTPTPSSTHTSGSKQTPVSVDGGWFAEVDGEWRQVPNPTISDAPQESTIRDGQVFVDSAHVPSKQPLQ